ncbi:MAG: TonB-dependent receptor [Gemmatimonadaceae bacterium]|nr:TonB-dependent receptor [Gemmatimonadaceae bacterium]
MTRNRVLVCGAAAALVLATVPAAAAQTHDAPAPRSSSATIQTVAPTARGKPTPPLERTVSITLVDVRLDSALDAIARHAGVELQYTARVVPVTRRVTLRGDGITVREALETVLRGTGVAPEVSPTGAVMLVRRSGSLADGEIVGRVTDSSTAEPLEGAVVTVRGTGLRAVTSRDGYYVLRPVPAGAQTIVARHLGYMLATQQVTVPDGGQLRVDFALRMGMTRLQDVVTTATGPKRRYELGNDITLIAADSITATEPVRSVTDLLETRVPGLVVMHSSGAPGDPSRLRLRGASSILRSNDPIVVVDGVRIYSDQSSSRSDNLAATNFTTPSPIDQIDPSSIETIEVIKGPSAATLYGQDAANGVIVITTKKGRPGPPQWSFSIDRGRTTMPGSYPVGYFGWGHNLSNNAPAFCALRDPTCMQDSLVRFQLLNTPDLTVLGHGERTAFTASVMGGTPALTYSVTGGLSDELGIIRMPDVEVTRYTNVRGVAPPSWMRRPQRYTRWNASSMITARIGASADVALNTMLQRGTQRRSSLEQQLDQLMGTYYDRSTGQYYVANTGGSFDPSTQLLSNYFTRVEDVATTFTTGVNATWRPLSWLSASSDAGLQLLSRDDEALTPTGVPASFPGDTIGKIGVGRGQSLVRTVNARMTATAPLPHGFRFQTAVGANYTSTSTHDFSATASGLSPGSSSIGTATQFDRPSESASDVTSFGWYVEPTISHKRVWLSTGLRLDGGSTFGTHVTLPAFPKLSFSYLVSDEPFFPFKNIINTLRLRVAYGQAGTWPGPADRLRLFQQVSQFVDSQRVNTLQLKNVGNTGLKPERSREIEGGFDADLFDDRVSISFTGYRKMRYDALMSVQLPPSVYGTGASILKNIGVVRNTGLELSLDVQPVRTDLVAFSAHLDLSRNHNRVISLAQGVSRFCTSAENGCVAAGYPLYGVWTKPIVGYADVNGNGIIDPGEVQVGDSLAYMGEQVPNFEVSVHPSLSVFRGAVTVSAGFHYEDGLTQTSYMASANRVFSAALNDPTAPLGAQAAAVAMPFTSYGAIQTVNTFRFNSLAVAFNASPSLARRFGARSLSIAVQGTNLGLWTNYRGKDPNVSTITKGNGVLDRGALPTPRTWQLRVSAGY